MTDTVFKQSGQQIKKLLKAVAEETLRQPGRIAEKAVHQVTGVEERGPEQSAQNRELIESLQKKDEKARATEVQTLRKKLEAEIANVRQEKVQKEEIRKEEEEEIKAKTEEQKQAPLGEPTAKARRGLFGFLGKWGKRAKAAREQAMPETVGKRVGG